MTEERIKEWLETHEPTVDDTMQLLAEARGEGRKEGIGEMRDEVILFMDMALPEEREDYDKAFKTIAQNLKDQP